MTALSTRDALEKAAVETLAKWLCREKHRSTHGGYCANCLSRAKEIGAPSVADVLLASGAMVDVATLADDEALAGVVADTVRAHDWYEYTNRCQCGERPADMGAHQASAVLRALAAALTEREAQQ